MPMHRLLNQSERKRRRERKTDKITERTRQKMRERSLIYVGIGKKKSLQVKEREEQGGREMKREKYREIEREREK